MYTKRFAMPTRYSGGTRRAGSLHAIKDTRARPEWKQGDVCLARVIGETRAPALVVRVRSGRATVYTLKLVPHSRTQEMIWTLADVMEPKSIALDETREIDWCEKSSALLKARPLTKARRQHLIDTISLWCPID